MPRRKAPTATLAAFGNRIRAMRIAKGKSPEDVARSSGLTKGWLSDIEHGLVNFTVDTCMRIAEGIGVPVVELFSREADPAATASEVGDVGQRAG